MSDTPSGLTQRAVGAATEHIASTPYCQAGATIALSGALAAALGQATANGSLDEDATGESARAARELQDALAAARARFLALADQDGSAIGEFYRLKKGGQELQGYALLCDGPQEMGELALDAARRLRDYRRFVCERARDDLEFSLTLMAGVARSAMQLLDSNLRIWPLPELLARYDPVVIALAAQVDALRPVERIR
jgi:hypothetical protein